jgi:hypothetical protein
MRLADEAMGRPDTSKIPPPPARTLAELEAERTLVEDLVFAAVIVEAAGTRASAALADRLQAAANRIRAEWSRWAGDMDGAGGVVARINGGPLLP